MSKNQILDELVYDQSSGALMYKGVRYLLIRPETLVRLSKSACCKIAVKKLTTICLRAAIPAAACLPKNTKIFTAFATTEIIEFMMNMGNQIGWGNFSLVRYDPTRKTSLRCGKAFTLCPGLWSIFPERMPPYPGGVGGDTPACCPRRTDGRSDGVSDARGSLAATARAGRAPARGLSGRRARLRRTRRMEPQSRCCATHSWIVTSEPAAISSSSRWMRSPTKVARSEPPKTRSGQPAFE